MPQTESQAAAGTTEISAEALDTMRRQLGLDQPVWSQYLRWLGDAGSA